ncbi:MAG: esterase family protein [Clostridia bacterium]|nr:esterase family protein [Clostridia bacterium]
MALLKVKFYSSVLDCETAMNVILPRVADAHSEEPFPVLYLLHGMGDSQDTWCSQTSIERYVENTGLAVIMPTTGLGWYTDAVCGNNWRTFIGEELPAICRDLFPRISTKREDTYIAGNSMGGYGAYALALTYPEQYCAAYGFSGAYVPFQSGLANDNDTYWTDIFGTHSEFTDSKNDLLALSAKLLDSGRPLPKLLMWCGYSDFIYDHSITMRDHLQKIGWPDFHYEESDGDHGWGYWNVHVQSLLSWIWETRK